MRHLGKTALIVLVVLAGAGCFAAHGRRYFDLGTAGPGPSGPSFDRTLMIERPVVEGIYDDFRIVYRVSPTEVNYYAYNFWAERPGRLVRDMIRDRLIGGKRFRRVDLEPGREPADWVLKIRLFRIEEEDRAEQWFGRLAMAFSVVEAATGTVVAERSFDRTEPLGQKDPGLLAGVVSKILAEEFEAFLADLNNY